MSRLSLVNVKRENFTFSGPRGTWHTCHPSPRQTHTPQRRLRDYSFPERVWHCVNIFSAFFQEAIKKVSGDLVYSSMKNRKPHYLPHKSSQTCSTMSL